MIDLDSFHEIGASLMRHKLRSALTALGVFLGILIFVAIVAFGGSLEGGVQKRMAGFANNAVMMWGQRTSRPYAGMQPNRPVQFDNSDIEALSRIDGIEHLAPRNQLGGFRQGNVIKRGSKTASAQVSGDYPAFQYIQTPVMREGRFLDDIDIAERRKVAVVGEEIVKQLFAPGEDAIGKSIEINGIYFTVVGVFGSRASGQMGDQMVRSINTPFTTFQQAFHFGDKVSWFAITGKPSVSAVTIEAEARRVLSERHRIAPDDDQAIGAWNAGKEFQKTQTLFVAIRWFLFVAGLLSLLAGAVGVSNIMLISVRERTKEIGVRKALGATPSSVVGMVIAEAVMLTTVAGYIGLVVGVAAIETLADWIESGKLNIPLGPPTVSLGFALLATVILIAAGALAGLIPAVRAAAIQPVVALRDE